MINEEGGIDPEQFRMEAMFDRMDAIGKSVLGLTIQCAQCHNHKYDPLTQEEYYRMFAFLNNTHEANVVVYTRRGTEAACRGVPRQIREIEDRLQHEHPDWQARMNTWEDLGEERPARMAGRANRDRCQQRQWSEALPAGGWVDPGGGLCADLAYDEIHRAEAGGSTVAAVRLELLNDPNLPLDGPGRSSKGLFALTEFHLEAAPADKPVQKTEVKIKSATSDVNPPEQELEPIFDDHSHRRRVTGPIAYAIDRKDETAWGIDAGPGRRNVPRNAVFVLEKPVSFPAGTILTFKLTQHHGGWNSDDNQNLNLGRFRFSVTDRPAAAADLVPANVRAILAIPQERRSPAQVAGRV